jgi:hypothetical protein
MVLGLLFVKHIPLPSMSTALEHGPASDEEREGLVDSAAPDAERSNSRTRLLPSSVNDEEDDEEVVHVHHQQVSSHYQFSHSRNSLEMNVSPTRDGTIRSTSVRSRRARSPSKEDLMKLTEGPNIHGKTLAMSRDFWLLFSFMSLCEYISTLDRYSVLIVRLVSGTGLMC